MLPILDMKVVCRLRLVPLSFDVSSFACSISADTAHQRFERNTRGTEQEMQNAENDAVC